MRIGIRHVTRYEYAEPAQGLVMRLRLVPPGDASQSVESWQVTVNDKPVQPWITNGFGESEAIWRAPGRMESVTIVAEGIVQTQDRAGVVGEGPPYLRCAAFLRQTPLTQADEAIEAFASKIDMAQGPLQALHDLCGRVHDAIEYETASTSIETTAAEAFAQGRGVCQDKTHIFIAACRVLGIPVRYVTGYLHDPERPADSHETHAWAEAHVDSLGWVAFDPTRGHCPMDCHVRQSIGLDAADAAPIRGVFTLGTAAALSHDVHIAPLPLEASGQSQSQQ